MNLGENIKNRREELKLSQEYVAGQSASEKERHGKKPNPILRANLIKRAIIFQATFLTGSVIHIRAYLNDMGDKVYDMNRKLTK